MKDEFRAVENMKTTLIDLAILKRVVLINERKKEKEKANQFIGKQLFIVKEALNNDV